MTQVIAYPRKSAANHEGPLVKGERDWLRTLEATVENNLWGFCEVGKALLKIRDNRLYRDEFSTFAEYCRVRWDMSRSYVHRVIESSHVVNNLLTIGNKTPSNESQARPLTKLSAPLQKEAWQKAVKAATDGEVTAKHVKAAVAEILDWEVKDKMNQTKEKIKKDEKISEDFKKAYETMAAILREAKENKWQGHSRSAMLEYLEFLKMIVRL